MLTLAEFRKANVMPSSSTALFGELGQPRLRVAFAYDDSTKAVYFATSCGSPYPPVFKLFGGGIKNVSVFLNYDDPSEGDRGVAMLHGSTLFKASDKAFEATGPLAMFTNHIKKLRDKTKKEEQLKTAATKSMTQVKSAMVGPASTMPVCQVEIEVQEQLRKSFPLPKARGTVVSDIQSVKPSVKNADGSFAECGMHTVHRLYMATAFTILRKLHGTKRDGVVALIVGKDGQIISWGRKNPEVPCWHGETSAIMALGGTIPPGSRVYSTLKPCNMCSGLIHDRSGGDAKVFWGQDDAGGMAASTVLDRERSGVLLDGNKGNGTGARAILLGDKPAKGNADTRQTFGSQLQNQQSVKGVKSSIDFVETEEAQALVRAAELGLKAKYAKYDKPKGVNTTVNSNTAAAIDYLVGFLRDLGLPPDSLGAER